MKRFAAVVLAVTLALLGMAEPAYADTNKGDGYSVTMEAIIRTPAVSGTVEVTYAIEEPDGADGFKFSIHYEHPREGWVTAPCELSGKSGSFKISVANTSEVVTVMRNEIVLNGWPNIGVGDFTLTPQ